MGFKKNNQYGKNNIRKLSQLERQTVEKLLDMKCGYRKIRKVTGISKSILSRYGYKTSNHKCIRKRITKDSCVNPSDIEYYVDMSDITTKSLCDANKRARVLKFANGYSIKLAILTNGSNTIIQLTKVKSTGETKELWSNILTKALSLGVKKIAIDTNCKFRDTHLDLVHLVKDSKYPYNQIVESKIGHLKQYIYRNIEQIRQMDIDNAIQYIYELSELVYKNKVRIEIVQTI